MIRGKTILLLVSSVPAFGVWVSWYLEYWRVMIICLLVASPIAIIDYYVNYNRGDRHHVALIASSLIFYIPFVIYSFAKLYEKEGLLHNGEAVHSLSSSVYFSVVTWTTLGYGDYQPTESVRMWAAVEAFFGYLFMALVISLIMVLIGSRKNA